MSLYLWINILSFGFPFLLSFDKKVHFYTKWRSLLPAIIIVGVLFIAWDVVFTQKGIWGFNEDYLSGIRIFNLPVEECLFFFTVPYACVFIYEVMKAYFPHFRPVGFAYYFALIFSLSTVILAVIFRQNFYTFYALMGAGIINWVVYFGFTPRWYPYFVVSFLVILIPFLVVNGILTGAITPQPIVWYNEEHIMGPRIYTIPVEDIFYNFFMLFPVVIIHEWLDRKFSTKYPAMK
ncbi:MAG: lycopene cyclase domain-containing protein [Brumimicrobium sp.]|nr:lycopene cyclase domain-containing protein [Brumimicrobium sp.]